MIVHAKVHLHIFVKLDEYKRLDSKKKLGIAKQMQMMVFLYFGYILIRLPYLAAVCHPQLVKYKGKWI